MCPTPSVRREVLQPINDGSFCCIWQCCDFLPAPLIVHSPHPHFPQQFGDLGYYFPGNLCLISQNGTWNCTQYFKCVHTSAQDTTASFNKSIIYFSGDGIIIGIIFNRYAFGAKWPYLLLASCSLYLSTESRNLRFLFTPFQGHLVCISNKDCITMVVSFSHCTRQDQKEHTSRDLLQIGFDSIPNTLDISNLHTCLVHSHLWPQVSSLIHSTNIYCKLILS